MKGKKTRKKNIKPSFCRLSGNNTRIWHHIREVCTQIIQYNIKTWHNNIKNKHDNGVQATDPIRREKVINNKSRTTNMCNYPKCTIVRREKDRRNILAELLEKTQIISQIIEPTHIQTKTIKRIQSIWIIPILLYGRASWTLNKTTKIQNRRWNFLEKPQNTCSLFTNEISISERN
jgi:hypothetical protein